MPDDLLTSPQADTPAIVLDRQPRPPRWHSLVPRWLGTLIWVDRASVFAAFLSYSWKGESWIAPTIQSSLQTFLRPWYKVRALNVFRDLSYLAASSDLSRSLEEKLDQSEHLIVLASSSAATSQGMEFEAKYWLSKPRRGQVLILVTESGYSTWLEIRQRLLPQTLRKHMSSPPLWLDISQESLSLRDKSTAFSKGQMIEALSQVFLTLYPGMSWPELRGEERRHRRRAWTLIWTAVFALSTTTGVAVWQTTIAKAARVLAEDNRLLAVKRQQQAEAAEAQANERGWEVSLGSSDGSKVLEGADSLMRYRGQSLEQVLSRIPDAALASNVWLANVAWALGRREAAPSLDERSRGRIRTLLATAVSRVRGLAPPVRPHLNQSDNLPRRISGGSFTMGTDERSDDARLYGARMRRPAHSVDVSTFWLQEHEVTNAEYEVFDPLHERFQNEVSLPVDEYRQKRDKYLSTPVVRVSWYDAMAYSLWIGGNLPTEAQWEFAARGSEGRQYPWSDGAPPGCDRAIFFRCGSPPMPVKERSLGQTPEGLYDMAGNTWEWCRDWMDLYSPTEQHDPGGPPSGSQKIIRGGSYLNFDYEVVSTHRLGQDPGGPKDPSGRTNASLSNAIGFRVAFDNVLLDAEASSMKH
jgi:formylglycine-generating enzyme required for sulfatase activity